MGFQSVDYSEVFLRFSCFRTHSYMSHKWWYMVNVWMLLDSLTQLITTPIPDRPCKQFEHSYYVSLFWLSGLLVIDRKDFQYYSTCNRSSYEYTIDLQSVECVEVSFKSSCFRIRGCMPHKRCCMITLDVASPHPYDNNLLHLLHNLILVG